MSHVVLDICFQMSPNPHCPQLSRNKAFYLISVQYNYYTFVIILKKIKINEITEEQNQLKWNQSSDEIVETFLVENVILPNFSRL